jgi:hypothetical protein
MACKRVAKKLKVTETTSQEVNSSSRVVEYLSRCCVSRRQKFRYLQEIPPSDPVDQGDEGDWETVGETAGASRSPAPTVEELLSQFTRQPPVAEGRTEPAVAPAAEEPAATEAEEEAPAEAGLVDIASILGARIVTVVRSSL